MVTLTNEQLQGVFNKKACSQNGMNEMLSITLNAIMYSERAAYLRKDEKPNNKANGYRPISINGYGRQLSLAIPRDRLGLFKPLLMLTLREEEDEVKQLCFEMYREGLTTRRIAKVFESLYKKRYSQSTISLMSQSFKEEMSRWRNRPLEEKYLVVYLDALQVKVRRENVQGEALYIALGVREDYTREVIAIENYPTESALGWESLLSKVRGRGVKEIGLFVADGLVGLEEKALSLYPKAAFQKCVTHFKRNVLYKVRASDKAAIAADLSLIFELEESTYNEAEAYNRASDMITKWKGKYPFLATMLSRANLRPYLTYLFFNFRVRSMIYTTNWVERLNKEFRRALKIRNAMPTVDSVLLLLSAIAFDLEKNTYAYPIHNLRKEPTFRKSDTFE